MNEKLGAALSQLARGVVDGHRVLTAQVGNVAIGLEVLPDHVTVPGDFDCYGPADIAGFEARDWRYIGLRMTVGNNQSNATTELWAVESGLNEPDTEARYLATAVLPDLFDQCQENTAALRELLGGLDG